MNRLIFLILRGGILASIGLLVVGLAVRVLSPGSFPREPVLPNALLGELLRLTPAGLLSLGVLLMVLTPVARVFLSLLVFAEERDRAYTLITGIVFANLLASMLLGVA